MVSVGNQCFMLKVKGVKIDAKADYLPVCIVCVRVLQYVDGRCRVIFSILCQIIWD